jgi:phosphoglycolate phosphatase-like HAD superfamily hydrolase
MSDLVKGHIIFDHDGTLVQMSNGQIQLFEGMEDFLLELKKENFALYVWTARPRKSALDILARLNIAHLFSAFYCYDDGIPKPDTAGLEQLTAGIEKNKIIHIGDSMTDIEGAEAYGIDVIAACWNDPAQLRAFKQITPLVVKTLEDCKKIIRGKYV